MDLLDNDNSDPRQYQQERLENFFNTKKLSGNKNGETCRFNQGVRPLFVDH